VGTGTTSVIVETGDGTERRCLQGGLYVALFSSLRGSRSHRRTRPRAFKNSAGTIDDFVFRLRLPHWPNIRFAHCARILVQILCHSDGIYSLSVGKQPERNEPRSKGRGVVETLPIARFGVPSKMVWGQRSIECILCRLNFVRFHPIVLSRTSSFTVSYSTLANGREIRGRFGIRTDCYRESSLAL
jgi:hypothetical protein